MGSVAEAELAISRGADAIGLVSAMPSGPGVIDDELIAEIARAIPPDIGTFLLTCETNARAIADQVRRAGVNTVQLVDRIDVDGHRVLRELLPDIALVQVIHVTGPESIDEAVAVSGDVDGILLDSGNPALAVKELGGTGRRHDWLISRRIRDSVAVPVFLAGGLNSANVAEAVEMVNPFGVDICSGVRTGGRLDEVKLSAFFGALAESSPE
jgi:phosphoribosylanthranilate isomerase